MKKDPLTILINIVAIIIILGFCSLPVYVFLENSKRTQYDAIETDKVVQVQDWAAVCILRDGWVIQFRNLEDAVDFIRRGDTVIFPTEKELENVEK